MNWSHAIGLLLGGIVGLRMVRRDPHHYLDGVLLVISGILVYL